jgi:hypothetical protein
LDDFDDSGIRNFEVELGEASLHGEHLTGDFVVHFAAQGFPDHKYRGGADSILPVALSGVTSEVTGWAFVMLPDHVGEGQRKDVTHLDATYFREDSAVLIGVDSMLLSGEDRAAIWQLFESWLRGWYPRVHVIYTYARDNPQPDLGTEEAVLEGLGYSPISDVARSPSGGSSMPVRVWGKGAVRRSRPGGKR